MKINYLAFCPLLIIGARGQTNLNSCSKQASCLSFSVQKKSATTCEEDQCEWEVCMSYNGCKGQGESISHICEKDSGTCHMAGNKLAGLATANEIQNWGNSGPSCHTVKAGSYAGFLVKDGGPGDGVEKCDGTASRPVKGCKGVKAQCMGIDDVSQQCAGNGKGQLVTCNWGFKLPACTSDSCGGDPHFSRWRHFGQEARRFSFHGQCDLVMMHNPDFENGLGLDLHIRTTKLDHFSFIEAAALRIGSNTLEVERGDDGQSDVKLFLNGASVQPDKLPMKLEGFRVSKIEHKKWDTVVVTLPVGDAIHFHMHRKFMNVKTFGSAFSFEDTVGIKGDFYTGELLARDGVTNMENNTDAFGQEWQVRGDDPKLFRTDRAPQWPQKCEMPNVSQQESRRLAYSRHDDEFLRKAQAACSGVSPSDEEFCMFDVMSTGDLGMADMFTV